MNATTLKNICEKQDIDFNLFVYNCGYNIEDLKLYAGKIYKPYFFSNGKPVYKFVKKYEIDLIDCI